MSEGTARGDGSNRIHGRTGPRLSRIFGRSDNTWVPFRRAGPKILKPPVPRTRSRMISDVQRAPTISSVWQPDKDCSWSALGHLDAAGEASRSLANSPCLLQGLGRCPCTPRNQEGKHRPKACRSLGEPRKRMLLRSSSQGSFTSLRTKRSHASLSAVMAKSAAP